MITTSPFTRHLGRHHTLTATGKFKKIGTKVIFIINVSLSIHVFRDYRSIVTWLRRKANS